MPKSRIRLAEHFWNFMTSQNTLALPDLLHFFSITAFPGTDLGVYFTSNMHNYFQVL